MRKLIASVALLVAGQALTGERAAAQYGYGPPAAPVAGPIFTPGGYGAGYPAAPGYGGSFGTSPTYGYAPGGWPGGHWAEPVDPAAAGVVRGLYHRYLGREPDPDGLRFWASRLAALGGDTGLLAVQFAAAAGNERAERSVYRPVYTSPRRSFRRFR